MSKQPDNVLGKLLGALKKRTNEILGDVVVVKSSLTTDVYSDTHGNSLTDGPFGFDSAVCANGSKPTAPNIAETLRTLKLTSHISDSSNVMSFDDVSPLGIMCATAPKGRL